MKKLLPIIALSLTLLLPAGANDDAIVVRQAVVYSAPSSASARVGTIDAGSRVSVFSRKGGWKEIFADEASITGWVRSYQVREGHYAPGIETESATSDSRGFLSGLASFSRKASSFFRSGSGSTSTGTATIGVRGLSEQEIKSAVADFEELEKMKSFASDRKRAKSFARAGRLKPQKVAFIGGKKK